MSESIHSESVILR